MRGQVKIEHEIREPCVLWESARTLGQERGLVMSPTCPLDASCNETTCSVLEVLEEKDRRLVKEKLASLRQELNHLG